MQNNTDPPPPTSKPPHSVKFLHRSRKRSLARIGAQQLPPLRSVHRAFVFTVMISLAMAVASVYFDGPVDKTAAALYGKLRRSIVVSPSPVWRYLIG